METLPDELLLHVFSFLPWPSSNVVIPAVCHRWRDVVASRHRGAPFCQSLSLDALRDFEAHQIASFILKAENLESIELARFGENLDRELGLLLTSLGLGAPKLRSLTIHDGVQSCQKELQFFIQRCPLLESLEFTSVSDLNDECILAISENLSGLRRLIAPAADKASVNEACMLSLGKCSLLEDLCLSNSRDVTDGVLKALSFNCKNLRFLDLSDCYDFTGFGVRHLASLTNLQKLNIEGCFNTFLPSAFLSVVQHCSLLEDLNIAFTCLGDEVILGIAERRLPLRFLELSGLSLSSSALVRLCRACPKLERVWMAQTQGVDNDALVAFPTYCGQLRGLTVYPADVDEFHWPPAPNLSELCLGRCQISDCSFTELVRNSPRLRKFDIVHCPRLTDQSGSSLPLHCPSLSSLRAYKLNWTAQTLDSFADHVESLPHLFEIQLETFPTLDKSSSALQRLQDAGVLVTVC